MNTVSLADVVSFTIISMLGCLFFGAISYTLVFRPELGQKVIKSGQVPWAPWTKNEGAGGILVMMVILLFVLFACSSCFMLFTWVQAIRSM